MFLQDIKIILCNISEPGNAGAVCRAMKNMGISSLRVAGCGDLETEKINARAVHAFDIWENACFFDNLADAVADCSIVVGTTRRRGHKRKNVSMPPRALASWLAERAGPAAIVFGNERTGLEERELELCNIASHIPVSDAFPSLNLSHAVQIYAYELFLALEPQNPVKGEWQAMNQAEINTLVATITDTLEKRGFYKNPAKDLHTRFFQDVISRAALSESEGRYFRDIIAKAARLGS
jgi:tRNA/rRNA methyltransferase/tRNA (cytidine32/uridine32-2'-O)-methyltransferase